MNKLENEKEMKIPAITNNVNACWLEDFTSFIMQ